MDGGAGEQDWAVALAVGDRDGERHRRAVGEGAQGQVDELPLPGRDLQAADRDCAARHPYPFPRVLVLPGSAFFSMNAMILPATSTPVAASRPSSPGDQFTSLPPGPASN